MNPNREINEQKISEMVKWEKPIYMKKNHTRTSTDIDPVDCKCLLIHLDHP